MLLIKNGKIIDGSGKPTYKGDILISGDKISAIGGPIQKQGIETIDALGLTVTPGFIDPNTDSDHYLTLFTNPKQGDFLLQGVTTIIGGHCGASLAPLLYGSLESIRKWADVSQINVGWHSVAEFLHILEEKKLGVNFGTLVGHSTIRRALIGEAMRDLTDNEMIIFEQIIQKSMDEGALGLSTGLGYAHSSLVPRHELKRLTQVIASRGGVYSTHLRSETDGVAGAVEEVIDIASSTKAKTLISHLRPLENFESQINEVRKKIETLPAPIDLHFDIFPFDTSLTPIYTLLPDWAKRGNLESMWGNITRDNTRDQIKSELAGLPLEKMTIASAPNNKYLVGKTVAEFGQNQNVSREEALLRLMTLTRMKAVLLYRNIDKKTAEEMVFDERALVGSNGASISADENSVSPERGLKTFTRFLELTSSRKNFPLEAAIKKITFSVAKKFGLKNRGLLKEGYSADIVILDGSKIVSVLVNGKIAVKDGLLLEADSGQIIKRL